MEGAIQAMSLGFSDAIGITGEDGLIHEDTSGADAVVCFYTCGLFFKEGPLCIDWKDVVGVECLGKWITFRGGLQIRVDSAYFEKDLHARCDDANDGPVTVPGISLCHHIYVRDILSCDDFTKATAKDFQNWREALEDAFWSVKLADKVRGLNQISINESKLLATLNCAYLAIHWIADELATYNAAVESASRYSACSRLEKFIAEQKEILDEIIQAQMTRVDISDAEDSQIISMSFANARFDTTGMESQARRYDCKRNARALGYKFDTCQLTPVDVLTRQYEDEESDDIPFGDAEWAKKRKIIVCTDERADLTTWRDGLQIPNTMVMDAQDIRDYNDAAHKDLKLMFEENHPQNGVMYVQHPMQQNVYIDIDSFHSGVLERKYNELIRLLVALGATQITCEVESCDSTDEKLRKKMKVGGGVDTVFGSVEGSFANDNASSRVITLRKKLATRIVKRSSATPHIPEGMVFYPFEDSWQHLASMAMEGGLKEYEVSLTYRKDYAVTGHSLASVGAKIKSKVPGYQFGVEGNFEKEFDRELKQLQSTVWHYHVKFGAGDEELNVTETAHALERQDDTPRGDDTRIKALLEIGQSLINVAKERISK